MKTSEETKGIYTALFSISKKVETLKKEADGYNYKYLTLEKLLSYLKPILDGEGVYFIQTVGKTADGAISLITRVIHESGEWLEEEASIPLTDLKGGNKTQGAGSAITYLRRYSLTALFGIAENDTDGLTADEMKGQKPIEKESIEIDTEKLKKVKAFYLKRGDTVKTDFIESILEGKNVKHIKRVYDGYAVDSAKSTFQKEDSKELMEDLALEEEELF